MTEVREQVSEYSLKGLTRVTPKSLWHEDYFDLKPNKTQPEEISVIPSFDHHQDPGHWLIPGSSPHSLLFLELESNPSYWLWKAGTENADQHPTKTPLTFH